MDQASALRVLIVEDNPDRENCLRSWLPPDVRPVVATSAGRAVGILRLDRGTVYAGVVLDHDLQERKAAETDRYLSGQDVVEAIVQHLSCDVPILVHSNNASQSNVMVLRLQRAGYDVTQIPMSVLTKESFEEWIRKVRENWMAIQGE
jgi:CheY-like chemotaxis protein